MKKTWKRLCTGFLALATVVTALPTTPVHAESKQYWTESAERVGIIEKVMNDGSIGSTFNEGYMKVEGETAYCIDINTDFKNGYKTRADASSRMSADQISDVALSLEYVKQYGEAHKEFNYKQVYLLEQCVVWQRLSVHLGCFKNVFSKNSREKRYSRTISPYWGFCGMFGFLGFGGFWTYYKFGEIFPFAFFIFFGFFSFFFEGKLSHILEDELFQENKRKAQLEAYKIGFKLLFVVIWLMAIGMFSRNVEWCAIFMLISVSLIYALVLFLSNYLLYRYEKRK